MFGRRLLNQKMCFNRPDFDPHLTLDLLLRISSECAPSLSHSALRTSSRQSVNVTCVYLHIWQHSQSVCMLSAGASVFSIYCPNKSQRSEAEGMDRATRRRKRYGCMSR
ncbi:hypothetical protein ATANTOWER_001037 [Ataeniobius toweri]|uniref:Uncharacterized protein n=1 Tax=Ataeniobius toweri TaxID=208326 RepID=A0ABU7BLY1_9TELE|nr:hypothetical protein [Ataeniobius toweri]